MIFPILLINLNVERSKFRSLHHNNKKLAQSYLFRTLGLDYFDDYSFLLYQLPSVQDFLEGYFLSHLSNPTVKSTTCVKERGRYPLRFQLPLRRMDPRQILQTGVFFQNDRWVHLQSPSSEHRIQLCLHTSIRR